jgi:membrane protein insertase Oxa1/YidC/SpoIIIJ
MTLMMPIILWSALRCRAGVGLYWIMNSFLRPAAIALNKIIKVETPTRKKTNRRKKGKIKILSKSKAGKSTSRKRPKK